MNHEQTFKANRDASGKSGFYNYVEMTGLEIAQIDDEIDRLKATIKELRRNRKQLADQISE